MNEGITAADEKNKALERQAEAMRLSILGKDGKTRDDKVLRIMPGDNPGITVLVLKELY